MGKPGTGQRLAGAMPIPAMTALGSGGADANGSCPYPLAGPACKRNGRRLECGYSGVRTHSGSERKAELGRLASDRPLLLDVLQKCGAHLHHALILSHLPFAIRNFGGPWRLCA